MCNKPIHTSNNNFSPLLRAQTGRKEKSALQIAVRTIGIFLLATSIVFAQSAHAGFFGFLKPDTSLADSPSDTSTGTDNSQTLSILDPIISPLETDASVRAQRNDTLPLLGDALVGAVGPMGGASEVDADAPTMDDVSVYVVHTGDTVASIAKIFSVTPDTIRLANDLTKKEEPKTGDVLIILPVSGATYTVKKGDTVASIAKKFSVDPNDIAQFNDIGITDALTVGDSLVIPGGDEALRKADAAKAKQDKAKYGKVNKKERAGLDAVGGRARFYGNRIADYFIRPLAPGVGRLSQGLHDNNAVDLAAPIGSTIRAAAEGTVIVAKFHPGRAWFGGFGNFVVIAHSNGTKTLYAHMSRVDVSTGQHVDQGETLGAVGQTGHATGPHVHFEVWGAYNPGIDGSWKN